MREDIQAALVGIPRNDFKAAVQDPTGCFSIDRLVYELYGVQEEEIAVVKNV